MMKRLILLGLFLVLICSVGAASAADIYVNATGGNDANNGTSWQHAKASIKNATGTVTTGETVHIANGIYTGTNNKNITITKNMTIIGQSQTGTIINAGSSDHIFSIINGINVTIQNLTLANGNSYSYGGAINNNGGNLTITNSTFTGNSAEYEGGGAINNKGGNLTVTGSIFTGNSAEYGGAIFNNGGNLTITDSTFTGNTAVYGGVIYNSYNGKGALNWNRIVKNTASYGFAIYCEEGGSMDAKHNWWGSDGDPSDKVYGSVTVNPWLISDPGPHLMFVNDDLGDNNNDGSDPYNPKKTIENAVNNVATNGIIYIANGTYAGTGNKNITITRNMTLIGQTGTIIDAQSAGLVFTIDSGVTVIIKNLTIKYGNATNGGAIYNNGNLTVTGSIFTGNNATYDGGAIYNIGNLTLTGSTFTNNTATSGGAIYNIGNLTISSSTFTSNKAKYGGAICTSRSVNVSDSIFTGNNANWDGGAIDNYGNLTLTGSTFKNNNATSGGAINNYLGNLTISSSTFTSNTATGTHSSGGAILNHSSNLTVSGSTFNNNTATGTDSSGGAIFNYDGETYDHILNVSGSTFNNNTATGTHSSGGAIYHVGIGSSNVNFNRFIENTASQGSVIYCDYGSVNATNNWWGSNNPNFTSLISNNVYYSPWIMLRILADPGYSDITADLTWNTIDGVNPNDQLSGGHVPDGIPVTFGIEGPGYVNPTHSVTTEGRSHSNYTNNDIGTTIIYTQVDDEKQTMEVTVGKLDTNLTVNPSSGVYKGSTTLTATLKDQYNNAITGANIQFTVGSFNANSITNVNGTATVTYSPINLNPGNHTITVTFTGNDNYNPSNNTKQLTIKDALKVTKTSPVSNASKVSVTSAITITFSENITSSVNYSKIYVKNLATGKNISISKSINKNILTIKTTTRAYKTVYQAYIPASAVKDAAGNNLAKALTYKFTTTPDIHPPTITNSNPKNNAVNVPTGKVIKVTFNENIKLGSKAITLKNSNGKTISTTRTISGKILTIKPKSKLAESKYKLTINTGSITDKAGNKFKAKTITFSVGTSPKVTKSDPKNNAKNIARTKTIKVTFNENIKKGTNYRIELVDNKGKKVTIQKTIKGKVLTITHTKLKAKTKYKLTLYTGSITDQAGNPLKARTISFTTRNT